MTTRLKEVDAVMVGMGWTGAIMARELTKAGGHVLVYNLVRGVMRQAAERQGVPPDRISFRDALRYLRYAAAEDAPPALLVNPRRRRRAEPRRVKSVNFRYPTLRKSREAYRQQLNAMPKNTGPLT